MESSTSGQQTHPKMLKLVIKDMQVKTHQINKTLSPSYWIDETVGRATWRHSSLEEQISAKVNTL